MLQDKIKRNTHKPIDLLLIGECLVDVFSSDNSQVLFGGSPANITMNFKQLGFNPRLCSSIGNDSEGLFLLSKFNEREIDTSLIAQHAMKTTKVKVSQSVGSPNPVFERESDHLIYFTKDLEEALKHTKILHVSYWPLTKEPSKSTVLKAINIAKEYDVLIAFDPNTHELLKTEETLSDFDLISLMRNVDIIKPSMDDAKRLFKKELSKDKYMDLFEELGIILIMMTLGENGVYVSYKKRRIHYSTLAKEVVDATGAGDAFWSGFYAGLTKGHNLEDTITLAQMTSAYALKHIGAITELPPIETLENQIRKK
ncbi:carbohydrate kinase family protein [Liberiplasma polymorphum]|uniref:carbohydrate kinase family protein n=1 Tax=Liberiplasma polymorphum TaxID=3374570 RepID=UPI003773E9EE